MATEEKTVQEQVKEMAIDVRNEAIVQTANLYLLARKVLLAGLGAVALSMDEAQEFVDRLAERGEIAEADAQKLMTELRKRTWRGEKGRHQAGTEVREQAARGAEEALEETVQGVLRGLNIPSKSDIESLSQKIHELSQKVDSLKAQQK